MRASKGAGAMAAALVALALARPSPAADAAAPAVADEAASPELARPATWSIPTRAAVGERLEAWLVAPDAIEGGPIPEDRRAAARDVWARRGGDASADLLDAVLATVAEGDPRCLPVLAVVAATPGLPAVTAAVLPEWVDAPATAPLERDVVRLWLGRELVRQARYDDGLTLLAGLDPMTSIDPAALLFHTAACQHWLVRAEEAAATIDRLLERAGEIPVRYERVARLLRAALASLEEESLDHIARRMRDVTRRLGQGRAGPATRGVQDGVIESLDKLIAKLQEQQDQQSGGGGSAGAGNSGNGKPMDDSRIAGAQGAGEVTRRDLGDGEGWGNLPPHEREEALQQIGREFPAHYREAIEQYFKRLAAGEQAP